MAHSLPNAERLCVAIVTGPHGVRGGVRLKSFTAAPADVGAYGELGDESGARRFPIRVLGMAGGAVLAKLGGVETREAAEALKGLRLFLDRAALPAPAPEEYYHADLIGLAARLACGTPLGRVAAIWDFGAGESLEIVAGDGRSHLVPFTRAAVPVIDLALGAVVIEPPAGLFDKPEPPAPAAQQAALAAEILGGEVP
jgi:16S rRNA processing protein RimM